MNNVPECSVDKECPLILECDKLNIIGGLKAENEKLKELRDDFRHAVGLLNSMVLAGEQHTKKSREIVKRAMSEQALKEEKP